MSWVWKFWHIFNPDREGPTFVVITRYQRQWFVSEFLLKKAFFSPIFSSRSEHPTNRSIEVRCPTSSSTLSIAAPRKTLKSGPVIQYCQPLVEFAFAPLSADRNHIPSTFVWLSGTLMYQTTVECQKVFYRTFLLVVSFRLPLLAPSWSQIHSPVDRRGRAGPGLSAWTIDWQWGLSTNKA